MSCCCMRRGLSGKGLLAVLAIALGLAACFSPSSRGDKDQIATDEPNAPIDQPKPSADQPKAEAGRTWPMLGGTVSRNLVNTVEKDLPAEWNIAKGKEKNIKWVAKLGNHSYGGPVIAGGKIFVGTNNEDPRNPKIKDDKGVVMCFRESDGEFLWQAVHDKLAAGAEQDWPQQGIASYPVVDGNRLYYVSNRCELVCADVEGDSKTKEAKFLWRLDMIEKLKVTPRFLANGSPLVAGDLVFVVTGNGVAEDDNNRLVVPTPKAPSFIAVNKKTGEVVWQDSSPGAKIIDGQWSNPVYAEVNGKGQVIFPGGDGWLYAFEATTGKPLWKFDCNPKAATEYKPGGRGERCFFLSTPVVYDNKVYVGVGQEPDDGPGVGHLWCIDITKKGDVSPVNDNFDPKAAANKDSALVWHFGGKAAEGADREFIFGRTLSTCAIHDGLLYVADLDGFFYCLDAKTGKKQWDYDLKQSVWGSPYWVDGKVYIGDDAGRLNVFAHGKQEKLLAKNAMRRPLKGPPVAVNGVLYVMTDTHLYAIANK